MAQKLKQDINLGARLKELRNNAGLTQSQLVAQMQLHGCSITRDIYSHMEVGDYNIRISEMICFKLIYGISYDDFFLPLESIAAIE